MNNPDRLVFIGMWICAAAMSALIAFGVIQL
jgi:hypothetical protein